MTKQELVTIKSFEEHMISRVEWKPCLQLNGFLYLNQITVLVHVIERLQKR